MKNKKIFLFIVEILICIIQIACFIMAYRNVYDFSIFVRIELASTIFLTGSKQHKIPLLLNLVCFFLSVGISIGLKPSFTINDAYNIIREDPELNTRFSSYSIDTSSTYSQQNGLIKRQYIFQAISDDQTQQITVAFDPITGEYAIIFQ